MLVAHNAPFDRGFLPEMDKPWLCTKRLAQHLWPDAPNHQNQTLRYWLNIDLPATAHDAAGDTWVTAHVLSREIAAYLAQGHPDDPTTLIRLAESPVRIEKMPFGKHRGKPLDEVPADYLRWALGNIADMDPDVRWSMEHALRQEVRR